MKSSADIPFLMNTDDELTKWRSETFFSKEPETLAWLDYFGSRISLLVDVGANIGLCSMYWLTLNEKNTCVACEPFLPNSQMLKSNLELNSFHSRCHIIERPLSEISQQVLPVISDERIGASGFSLNISSGVNTPGGVETTTLDETLTQVDGPCIVKVDTDGIDFEILKGASNALSRREIISVLIESSEEQQVKIGEFLKQYDLILDDRFSQLEEHSDIRRIAGNKIERNRIYSIEV